MKRICIYLTYDKQNIVDRYIGYMLNELKSCVDSLVVVCNELEVQKGKDILEKYADKIFYRENKGFDAGGFKDALCTFLGWEEVLQYDELVLVNDSFFGPFRPMKDIFYEMSARQVDFWGLIKHGERMENGFHTPEHIQSFFMTIGFKMLHSESYRQYWENMPYYTTFMGVVGNYELKFTQYFSELGFTYSVLAETDINDSANIENNYVQYSALAYELIKKRNFPFFKKQQISYDMLGMQTQENLCLAMKYIENNTDYDTNLIWDNVIRTMDISDIQHSFALQYIIPEKKSDVNIIHRIGIAVCVRCEEAMEYVLEYLDALNDICDIYIYSMDGNLLTTYQEKGYQIRKEDNPYVILKDMESYDYICMINDADVTSDVEPSCAGKSYFYCVWENLVKNRNHILGIIEQFENDFRLGYLASPQSNHARYFRFWGDGWNGKFNQVKEYLEKANVNCQISMDKPPYSDSDNFWIRGDIIKQIVLEDADEKLLNYCWIYFVQAMGYYTGIVESPNYAAMNQINIQHYLKQIACQVKQLFGDYKDFGELKKRIFQAALGDFCRKHANIMIYGTGGMAREYQDILPKVIGYIVSDGQPKEDNINGLPVLYLSEAIEIDDLGIIVCMLPKNQAQVIPLLEENGITDYICI